MEMTQRLRKALNEVCAMQAPSLEMILSSRGFRYEANRVKELIDAWKEMLVTNWKEPRKLVVHFTNCEDDSDVVLATEGVELVVIDWETLDEGRCPYCQGTQLQRGGIETNDDPEKCMDCGLDFDWDGAQIFAWLMKGK